MLELLLAWVLESLLIAAWSICWCLIFFKNNLSHFSLFTKMSTGIKRTISSFYCSKEDLFSQVPVTLCNSWEYEVFCMVCFLDTHLKFSKSSKVVIYIVSSSEPCASNIWGRIQHIVIDITVKTRLYSESLDLNQTKLKLSYGVQHSRFSPPSSNLISNSFNVIFIYVYSDFWLKRSC